MLEETKPSNFVLEFNSPSVFSVEISNLELLSNRDGSANLLFDYNVISGEPPAEKVENLIKESVILALAKMQDDQPLN